MDQASWWTRAVKFWKRSASPETQEPSDASDPARVRLVIDTEVFVVAARTPNSASRRVLDAVVAGRATLLVDPVVFVEYRQRLPRVLRSDDRERLIRSWIGRAETIAGGDHKPSRAAYDDKFVALAAAGKADAIVSNDERRLRLRNRLDIPVLRPDEALRMIGGA
ncbi:MAG: PIN domain-containing protein [Planctomycetaceae bacterium]